MRAFTFILALAISATAYGGQVNRLTLTEGGPVMMRMLEARARGFPLLVGVGEQAVPVLIMEPIQSRAFQNLFPSLTAHRLISSGDIIHYAHFSALILNTNRAPVHLRTDDDVMLFVSINGRGAKSKEGALQLVRVFADLRSYRIVETPPDFPDARPKAEQPSPEPTDYKFMAEEHDREWRVYATFFTSEHSNSYDRYVFSIWKRPGSGISLSKPVLIRLGNWVL